MYKRIAALLQHQLHLSDKAHYYLTNLTSQPHQFKINFAEEESIIESRLFPSIYELEKSKLIDLVRTDRHLILMLNTFVANSILDYSEKYLPKLKDLDHRKNFIESALNTDYDKLFDRVINHIQKEYPRFNGSPIIRNLPINDTNHYSVNSKLSFYNMLNEEGEAAIMFMISHSIEQLIQTRKIAPARFSDVSPASTYDICLFNVRLRDFLFHILSRSWSIQ